MEENLMQTQTGGTGDTIQLQTQETPSAEQFDVKINPPVDSEPVQPTPPTEPVKPVATVPTEQEAQQQAILPTAPVEQPVVEQPVDDLESIFNDEEILINHQTLKLLRWVRLLRLTHLWYSHLTSLRM
jgi:hypothetical protein